MRTGIIGLLSAGPALALLAGLALARPEASVPLARGVAVHEAAAERLAGAVRIRTLAEEPGAIDGAAFAALHAYLRGAFPRVHAQLSLETVATHSLLYAWPGSDPSLAPILLMGHLDVVPVEPGTEKDWTHVPF